MLKIDFLACVQGSQEQRVSIRTSEMSGGNQVLPPAAELASRCPLLGCTGGTNWKGWSKLQWPSEEGTLPGSPSGTHDASDMLSLALLLSPPEAISNSFPEGRGNSKSPGCPQRRSPYEIPPSSCQQSPTALLGMRGLSLSPLPIPKLTEATGPLGACFLCNPSSGPRGAVAC